MYSKQKREGESRERSLPFSGSWFGLLTRDLFNELPFRIGNFLFLTF